MAHPAEVERLWQKHVCNRRRGFDDFNSDTYNDLHGPLLYVPSLGVGYGWNKPPEGYQSPRPATMRLPLPKEHVQREQASGSAGGSRL